MLLYSGRDIGSSIDERPVPTRLLWLLTIGACVEKSVTLVYS